MITVAKFGGSSVASAVQFSKVKNIIENDSKRKIVVVSAPGKRFKEDSKVTDLLYLLSSHIKYGVDYNQLLDNIFSRCQEIAGNLNLKVDLEKEKQIIIDNIKNGASEEYIVSRGEYLCAKLMADYLGYVFCDASEMIYIKFNGRIDKEKTKQSVLAKYQEYKNIVVPGFYATLPSGEVTLFSRGGSDITGSIMAMAVKAEKYENWTDVSGILMADPRIIENPRKIKEISYDELRELAYMGASVLHEETISPIKEDNIPIYILNTNKPEDEGTKICREVQEDADCFITGISGKKNFRAFTIVKKISRNKLNVIRDTLNVFDKFGVTVEHIPTAVDSFSVIVNGAGTERITYDIINEIKQVDGVLSVEVDNDLSLVAVVGSKMVFKPGISGKVFSVFGNNGINIKTISQGIKEFDIIVGVSNNDFEKSIKALYNDLVNN